MKKCSKCKTLKDFSQYSPSHGGLTSWCKKCKSYAESERRKANPELVRKQARDARNANPRSYRSLNLKKSFGINIDQYELMLKKQNNVCAICRLPETVTRKGKVKNLAVDHNHSSGEIRSLLCQFCNQALGLVRENFDVILNMAKYVQYHNHII